MSKMDDYNAEMAKDLIDALDGTNSYEQKMHVLIEIIGTFTSEMNQYRNQISKLEQRLFAADSQVEELKRKKIENLEKIKLLEKDSDEYKKLLNEKKLWELEKRTLEIELHVEREICETRTRGRDRAIEKLGNRKN